MNECLDHCYDLQNVNVTVIFFLYRMLIIFRVWILFKNKNLRAKSIERKIKKVSYKSAAHVVQTVPLCGPESSSPLLCGPQSSFLLSAGHVPASTPRCFAIRKVADPLLCGPQSGAGCRRRCMFCRPQSATKNDQHAAFATTCDSHNDIEAKLRPHNDPLDRRSILEGSI